MMVSHADDSVFALGEEGWAAWPPLISGPTCKRCGRAVQVAVIGNLDTCEDCIAQGVDDQRDPDG